MSIPKVPAGTKAAGRALWRSVLGEYELEQHELVLLKQACRAADVCDDLQVIVDREGPMIAGRVHPALVELRQQRIIVARLIVALRVPLGVTQEEHSGGRLQQRGTRGVYAIKGGVS